MQSLTERSLNENFARGEGVENVKSHTSLLRSSLNPTRLGGEVRNAKHSTTRHISNGLLFGMLLSPLAASITFIKTDREFLQSSQIGMGSEMLHTNFIDICWERSS